MSERNLKHIRLLGLDPLASWIFPGNPRHTVFFNTTQNCQWPHVSTCRSGGTDWKTSRRAPSPEDQDRVLAEPAAEVP